MPEVRFRTASDKKKAMAQYDELRRAGRVERAVVIAELKDGSFRVLGQGMSPEQIGQSLVIAADALAHVEQQAKEIRPEPHIEPEKRGEHNLAKPAPRAISMAEDGTFIAPAGENFISCGECDHPRWYILHDDSGDRQSRMACAHCGNEVVSLAIYHPTGRA